MLESVDANLPRLVVVSPFYLDAEEVTVSKYRSSGVARQFVDPFGDLHDDPYDSGGVTSSCTFSVVTLGGTYDSLPVNCLAGSAQFLSEPRRGPGQRGAVGVRRRRLGILHISMGGGRALVWRRRLRALQTVDPQGLQSHQ